MQSQCTAQSVEAQETSLPEATVTPVPTATVSPVPSATVNPDIAILRAQLEEIRRSEDRLLSTVLTSIGIRFTVLVLVNVGLVVLANRNYERDEKAMRIILREDAKELDATEALRVQREFEARDEKLIEAINDAGKALDERIGDVEDNLQRLAQSTETVWETISLMRVNQFESAALNAESAGDRATAAMNQAWLMLIHASLGRMKSSAALLPLIIMNLEKIQPADSVEKSVLTAVESSLHVFEEAYASKNPQLMQLVLEALDNVISIRRNRWPDESAEAGAEQNLDEP